MPVLVAIAHIDKARVVWINKDGVVSRTVLENAQISRLFIKNRGYL